MLPFLLIPIAAYFFSSRQTEDESRASASVLFSDKDTIVSAEPDREAATNVELLSLDAIKQSVERSLAESGPPAKKVDATQDGDANVLTITAADPSPERAAATANAYAGAFIAFRRDDARQTILEEERFQRKELARLSDSVEDQQRAEVLAQQLRKLRFDRIHETGGARMVQRATPPANPVSPARCATP